MSCGTSLLPRPADWKKKAYFRTSPCACQSVMILTAYWRYVLVFAVACYSSAGNVLKG